MQSPENVGQKLRRKQASGPSNLCQIQKNKPCMNSDEKNELLRMGEGKRDVKGYSTNGLNEGRAG